MPEGDTVFALATHLKPALAGQRLLGGRLAPRAEVELSATVLAGRRVADVYARGKHLFIAFDDRALLRSHLGMYGSWHSYAPGEVWQRPARQASIVLETRTRVFVCFNAAQVEWLNADGPRHKALQHALGPDLCDDAVAVDAIVQRARTRPRSTPLVDVLLDQRIASGIGNVYKSEVLFLAGLPPLARLGDIDDAALAACYRLAATLLRANRGGGPRITRRARDDAGQLWVYRRRGLPCLRCDMPIRAALLGRHRRSTYWCPRCQRGGSAPAPV